MKVVIACGGTGGHLFPGLAVAEALRDRAHETLLLVSEKEIDALALRGQEAFQCERIASVGMPRMWSPAMAGFVKSFLSGFLQCRSIYNRFQPDAVLGMGGFTSTAPILAGKLARIPTFIHESNAIPGKANILNARFAQVALLGFDECKKYFPKNAVRITGTPIRSAMRQHPDRSTAARTFGFDPEKPILLVMGGSQGAHGLNRAMVGALPFLKELQPQIIHLAGKNDETMVTEAYRARGIAAHVCAFHHQMEQLYAMTDLAVARSGAASLSELSFFGIPSVLLPYPHAAEDHQTRNAEIFSRAGAAELLPESDAGKESLGNLLASLLKNPGRLKEMSEAARMLAPTEAANEVVDCIEEFKRP